MTARPSTTGSKPCLRRLARLSAYLDRDLPQAVRDRIRSHMDRCGDCRVVLRTLKKTIELCRRTSAPAPPRAVSQRVLAALRRELASCRDASRAERRIRRPGRERKMR
jgi:anti-sigma factor RsiW